MRLSPENVDLLSGSTVVIVDDEPGNVVLLMRLLRTAGVADVRGVTDARQAVRSCLDTAVDLVLLDLNMPHLDGFGVLAALRSELPHDTFLPVLVLTADVTTEVRDRALQAGAKDFLTKPFDTTEVILRVCNLLETRSLYTQVRDHNAQLNIELALRKAGERRAVQEHQQRLQRITSALAETPSMLFQPIVDLHTGDVLGVEALARFDYRPQRPPNEWFDEAQAVGLREELELAAVGAALRAFDELPPETFLSVNISPTTILRPELAQELDTVPTDRVVLELTEHARIQDYDPLLATLRVLRSRGVRIAVDDAGAGYSGLQHILRLRPDVLKLDLALTRGVDSDPARRALAIAMVSFANELGASTVAEGIETQSELETLRGLEVPYGQGYRLARPGPLPWPDICVD